MRILKPALALAFGVALSGCAFLKEATTYRPPVTDSQEAMKAEMTNFRLPQAPAPGKAVVYVVRPSGLGTFVHFNVFLDDREEESEMGNTQGSQHIYFQVSPGEHTIYSKAENWAEIKIAPASGETVFIQQHPGLGLLIARNSLTRMDETLGKYQVMQTTLGTILRPEKDVNVAPASGSASDSPAGAEKDVAMADWKTLPADQSVKVYSKAGAFAGKIIKADASYLWITQGDGKKAFSTFEIERVTVPR